VNCKPNCSFKALTHPFQHPEDAQLAVKHGADGIIVSNHGGKNRGSTFNSSMTNIICNRTTT